MGTINSCAVEAMGALWTASEVDGVVVTERDKLILSFIWCRVEFCSAVVVEIIVIPRLIRIQ